jgi:hypothetical protein
MVLQPGAHSRVGGEVNNPLFQLTQKRWVLGNAVIGEWCNIERINNSNLKKITKKSNCGATKRGFY